MKTQAEYAQDPSVIGLVGKEKRAAMKALYDADKAAQAPAPKAKLPSNKELARLAREYDNADHSIKVVQETEKAVAIELRVDFVDFEKTVTKLAWIPKSLLKDGKAPGWFLTKKQNEVRADARAMSRGAVLVAIV